MSDFFAKYPVGSGGGGGGGFITMVTDTNSIDLTVATGNLSADLKLSSASAGMGKINASLSIQSDGLQAQVPILVGDSGSGGVAGVVPAPASGDAAAGKFLSAAGTFAVPGGTVTSVSDTDSIDLTLSTGVLSADLKLSSTGADPSNEAIDLIIETDGLRAQIPLADSMTSGALTSTDWNTFNSKQNALSLGNLTGTNISVTGGTGAVIGSGVAVSIPQSVATTATPTFAGMTLTAFDGVVKAVSGVLSASLIVDADIDAGANIDRTKLASGNADYVLINDGLGVMSEEQHLAISRGGTGQGTKTAGFDALSPLTTKGDLIVSDGTDNVRQGVGSNGQVLVADSAQTNGLKWGSPTYTAPTTQIFTSGTGTYTTPAGVLYIRVRMVGGGGGGGGSGNLGGGSDGTTGDNSTFGGTLLTSGGGGGGGNRASTTGAGGAFTINSPAINLGSTNGSAGSGGQSIAGSTVGGGTGGTSPFGGAGGGGSATGTNANVDAASGSGSGGGGGGSNNSAAVQSGSGGGSAGFVYVQINSPSSTYAYVVGGGGTNGSAGSGGQAGGAGGSGRIIVEEYYQ